MERKINNAATEAVRVSNISPATLKAILDKIEVARTSPGDTNSVFVKGPTDFSQKDDFYKFSRPGDTTPLFSIESKANFKIDAEVVKGLEQR